MGIESWEQSGIIVCGAKEETVVHVTLLSSACELLFQSLQRGGLRHRVGHVEESRHAPGSSGPALCVDIGLLRQARFAEMHMVVDDTWQHETARSVDDLVESRIRGAGRLIMGSYPITDLSP